VAAEDVAAGAAAEEASEPLPGDDRTPHPRVQSTRAVTIDAPPEQVWPWLLQMGIGRAGFYTHDWVGRLIAHARYVEGKHSATRIHPEIPPLQAGDTVPMGAGAFATVPEVEPYRHLVGQETYVLRALPGGKTRLIARYRGAGFVSPAAHAIRPDAGRLPGCCGSPSFTSAAPTWPCVGSTSSSPTPCTTTWRPGCSPGSRHARKESTPMPPALTRRPPPWSRGGHELTVHGPPSRSGPGLPASPASRPSTLSPGCRSSRACCTSCAPGCEGAPADAPVSPAPSLPGEVLVSPGNGFRCPLTEPAERYGAQSGSVTDIHLPKWFAHNMPAIHTPLLVVMTYLHARKLRPRQTLKNGQRRAPPVTAVPGRVW
jgi:hypothetical protein